MRIVSWLCLLALALGACGRTATPAAAPAGGGSATTPSLVPLPPTPSPTAEVPRAALPTLTVTVLPSETPSPSIRVDYLILRGKVNVERVSCRYGPGSMYLFLYGLRQGAVQDIVGRTDTGSWVLTQAHGDTTRCWVKADLLDISGNVMGVEMVYPDKYALPVSPYYVPPYTASASRAGDQVTITWTAQSLRAGDRESDTSPLIVVETWVCRDGQLVFTPIGAVVETATVTDEHGCLEPSHGRVFLAEKHGYAGPTEIPWPPAMP